MVKQYETLADFLQWCNNLDVTPIVLDVCGISPMMSYCIYIYIYIYISNALFTLALPISLYESFRSLIFKTNVCSGT